MSTPLLSIIVNNHNYGRFLTAAVESALVQEYPNTEVLVVDDGSTDDSRSIISGFGDRIVPVLKENGGQTSTFNAGLRASRGEIILFLDADDFLLPGAALRAVERLRQTDAVKVHWPLWVVDEHGHRTGDRKPTDPPPEGDLKPLLIEHGPEHPGWPPTSGNAWRRDFLDRIFPIPEVERQVNVGSCSADSYMTMLAPLFGTVAAIQEPLSCYRVHGQNDHSCLAFEKRLRRDVWVFDHFTRVLEQYCRDAGLPVDPQRWRNRSWCYRLHRSIEEIDRFIPAGLPFILVDDGHWMMPPSENRRAIPFIEREGQYWGPPNDDPHAVEELKRLRQSGSRFIVLAWPAFWWIEHYAGFYRYVREHSRCLVENERLIVFELK